jgi:hypothetical protein
MVTSSLWVVLKKVDSVQKTLLFPRHKLIRMKICVDKTSSSWEFLAT